MSVERLSAATVARLPDDVRRPDYARNALQPRMVHLGVGAFHRAHQALFTEDANEATGGDWGTVGISLRSPTAEMQLAPQDGLYTVGVRNGTEERLRLVGSLLNVLTAPRDPEAALSALCDPTVSVVTLTITEKGYALDPATGALLTDQDDVSHDLGSAGAPRSTLGYLAKAIDRRRVTGAPPLTLLSCDNLPSNGRRLKSALVQFAGAVDENLARHVETHIRCPESMVDRIVPATTTDDLLAADRALGLRDEGYVKTEPFRQWVIQDDFAGPRPAWEAAGAMIVPDVTPYETAKLRLLNGPHSAIAYLGYLSGHGFVHEVMADPDLSYFVRTLMDDEIAPTVTEPGGMPLGPYADALRTRFENSALQHRTWQIAMDGSQKLPQRLLNTIRDRIARDLPYSRLATAVAAWIVYSGGRAPDGETIDVRDPLAGRMAKMRASAGTDVEALLRAYLGLNEVFGDLGSDDRFATAIFGPLRTMLSQGPRAAVQAATA